MVGEIHLAHVYFTNGAASKIRPIVIIKHNSFNDLVFLPLTTNNSINGVQIDNSDIRSGFLPKTSIVIFEKPGVTESNLLIKKLGELHKSTYTKIIDELVQFLQK